MQSNAAGASLGPRKRFDGMAKLLDRSRRFVIPTMREAYTPMTMTSTTMMTLNSNANTNGAECDVDDVELWLFYDECYKGGLRCHGEC